MLLNRLVFPWTHYPTCTVFKVLQEKNRFIVQAVIDRDFSALYKVLVDFKHLLGVMFDDGWSICPSFEAFSKSDDIDLQEASFAFIARDTPFVPIKFLHLEAECGS